MGDSPLLVMYCTQQGNSKAIAERLHIEASEKAIASRLMCSSKFEEVDWMQQRYAVFVVATTGNGDPPDLSMNFMRFLKKRTNPKDMLSHLSYAVLALGDTNYDKFCECGKIVDRYLEQLGAQRIWARGDADDAVGLEDVVEPWIDGFWKTIQPLLVADAALCGTSSKRADAATLASRSTESCTAAQAGKSPVTASTAHVAAVASGTQGGKAKRERIVVMHACESGDTAPIAARVAEDGAAKGAECVVMCASKFEEVEWTAQSYAVFVVSTTGEGGVPEKMTKFVRFLKKQSNLAVLGNHPRGSHLAPREILPRLQYGVLGLGDSSKPNFCAASKKLDGALQELGAQRVCATGSADEVAGLEAVVEPWAEGVWTSLTQAGYCLGASENAAVDGGHVQVGGEAGKASSVVDAVADVAVVPSARPESALEAVASIHLAERPCTHSGTSNFPAPNSGTGQCRVPQRTIPDCPTGSLIATASPVVRHSAVPAQPSYGRLPRLPLAQFTVLMLGSNSSGNDCSVVAPQLFNAPLILGRQLTTADAVKQVLHIELDITGSNIGYTPGDAIGVVCPNRAETVDTILACLDLSGNELVAIEPLLAKAGRCSKTTEGPIPMEFPCTLRRLFAHHYDLNAVPKKCVLRLLAEHTANPSEKHALLRWAGSDGRDAYEVDVRQQALSIVELLQMHPSCKPPLAELLSHLPRLSVRYYSIASSPLEHPTSVHFAFSVVKWDTPAIGVAGASRRRLGLCTNWLAELICKQQAGVQQIFVPILNYSKTSDFYLPEDLRRPCIMVGPGTGVSPFVGFLRHRKQMQSRRHEFEEELSERCEGNWRGMGLDVSNCEEDEGVWGSMELFFGCRHRQRDFLYRDLLESMRDEGVLTKLHTAFSRDTEHKVYVQHRMTENAKSILDAMLNRNGCLYVCGCVLVRRTCCIFSVASMTFP